MIVVLCELIIEYKDALRKSLSPGEGFRVRHKKKPSFPKAFLSHSIKKKKY